VTDLNGKTTSFACDAMDRLVMQTPDASFGETAVSYSCTATGQRLTMTDGSCGATSYGYDNQNRPVSKTNLAGTPTYTYDKAGNRLTVSSSNTNGTSVVYTYDNLNRVQTVVDNNAQPGLNLTAYSFDAVGNLSSTELANGVTVTPSVDLMNRVKELAATGKPGAAYSYQYGLVGNRTYAAGSAGGPLVSASYTYDSIYRLTQESLASAGVQAENGALTYGLDPVGNRQTLTSTLSAIATQPPMSYNANDRLLTNSYDANGNTLGAGGKTFAYDSQDRLTSFNGGAVTMVYDGDGNRVSKTAGGVTTLYLVDEANPTGLAQVVEEIAGGAVKTRYVYGLERIGQTQVASGTTSFYGYDGHGDVRYLTDVAGKVTDTYDYDAFGNVVGTTGTTANVYRYQGEAFDSETGLYYLRARYYDPVAGRFLSVDPLADQGQHPYTYAGADPVNGHDPTGTQDFLEFTMLAAVFMPSTAAMAGMAADLECIASLALSKLLGPAAMMVGVKGCLAMFRDTQEPSTPGPGSPSDPDKPCKCKDKQCCKWIDAHGADVIAAGLPEANALALTAIESDWGRGYFARTGNSFFNLESCWAQGTPYPPFKYAHQTGWMKANESNHWCPGTGMHYMLVAAYSNSRDSFMSATATRPNLKEDDPTKFAKNAVADGIYAGRDPNFLSLEKKFEKCLKQ
jgi:RHS repeat-associated protein